MRGTPGGETPVSKARTREWDEGYDRALPGAKPQRGRWVWDAVAGRLVSADEYRAPPVKCGTGILADRIHEGTTFHDGDKIRDLGSRAKRRQFMRETGMAEASDYSRNYREAKAKERERAIERRIDASAEAAARKLYHEGKWRE